MVLLNNNTLEIFNLDIKNHNKNIFSLPEETKFIIHDENNQRLIMVHQNQISYYSLEGKFLDFVNFKTFSDFTAYHKIGYFLFLGIFKNYINLDS